MENQNKPNNTLRGWFNKGTNTQRVLIIFGIMLILLCFCCSSIYAIGVFSPSRNLQSNIENSQKTPASTVQITPSNTSTATSTPTSTPTSIPTPSPTKSPISTPQSNIQTPPPVPVQCKYSCISPDRDCIDFSTHAEAEEFFNCCGFSANNDPMRLDKARGVGNGLACESLP